MASALLEAEKAYKKNEVPIGAVVVVNGKIIARAHNLREFLADPTAHAEILAIKKAAKKLGGWRLNDATLYCTLVPCPMCAGAVVHARLKELVYGADDTKAGPRGSNMVAIASKYLNYKVKVKKGVLKENCSEIISRYFKRLRKKKK
jgi:tRNA(adenine34) deaminase